jgi:hypothetical protein
MPRAPLDSQCVGLVVVSGSHTPLTAGKFRESEAYRVTIDDQRKHLRSVGAFLVTGIYGLSHLLLMGNTTDFTGTPLEPLIGDGMFRHFQPIFRSTLIANVNMTAERGYRLLAEGLADVVAFARPYIANPDLVERLATGAPLAEIDWPPVYDSGRRGYSDYPPLRHAMA